MIDNESSLLEKSHELDHSNFTYISSWSNHYKSWKNNLMFEVLFVSPEPFLSDYPMKLGMGIRHADPDMQLFEYPSQFDALGSVEPGFVEFACFWPNLPDKLPEESERVERLVI